MSGCTRVAKTVVLTDGGFGGLGRKSERKMFMTFKTKHLWNWMKGREREVQGGLGNCHSTSLMCDAV